MNIFQDGVRLFKEGRYSEAVEKLHTVASADHGNHKAWNALGVALSKTGDLEQSLICFENALSLDPGNETYKKNLEKAQLKRTHAKPVVPVQNIIPPQTNKIETVVFQPGYGGDNGEQSGFLRSEPASRIPQKTDKNELPADFLNRALSLFGQASYHDMPDLLREALDYTERALQLDPEYFDAWQLKVAIQSEIGGENPQYLQEALESCNQALLIRPDQASMWFKKAEVLEILGKYDEAVSAYDKAYENSSDEPMRFGIILIKKASALEFIGKETQAIQAYEQVPVTDRFYGEAMEKKAAYLEKTGNTSSAISAFRTAGLNYIKLEEFQKAVDSFTRLLALEPGDEEATYNLGVASLSLYDQTQSKKYLEDAFAAFDSVLTKEPENITYLIQKGRCLLDLGRFEEGLQCLDRALWINPKDGITLMNKGIALYQLSRHEEALKYFDLVISYYPEHSAPWLMKSRIHLDWKQLDTALFEIDNAIKLSPGDSRAWEQKAVILRALGREDEARTIEERGHNGLET